MAWISYYDRNTPWRDVGGTVLQASVTKTADFNGTAVDVGKGTFFVELKVTNVHQEAGGFDSVNFFVEGNTKADTSTYYQMASHAIGDATGIGVVLGAATYGILVDNPLDNGIRLAVYVSGSTDSVTYSAKIYPFRGKNKV